MLRCRVAPDRRAPVEVEVVRPAAEPPALPSRATALPASSPRRRATPRRGLGLFSAWLRTALTSGLVIAGLVALAPPERGVRPAWEPRATASVRASGPRVTDSPWEPVAGAAFTLSGPDWRARDTVARRNTFSGAREDTITAGAFEGGAPLLRLVVTRGARPSAGSFYVTVARRAAAAGLMVARSGPPSPLATKFGIAEVAPVALASGGLERACTALRFGPAEGGFGVEGWVCGAQGQAPADARIACALDGLSLAPGAVEPALKGPFAEAEKRRSDVCGGAERTVVATGRGSKTQRR